MEPELLVLSGRSLEPEILRNLTDGSQGLFKRGRYQAWNPKNWLEFGARQELPQQPELLVLDDLLWLEGREA